MNAKQRAQVVELLRCAADHVLRGDGNGSALTVTSEFMFDTHLYGTGRVVSDAARLAEQDLCESRGHDWRTFEDDRYEQLLEAAQRCEDGSWPE